MVPQGAFLFLTFGAIALFSFLGVSAFSDARRREREAYYKNEGLRRIAEMPGEGAKQVIELMREDARIEARKKREGLKIGGLINVGVGVALCIFLFSLGGKDSPYLCGLFPGLIGVGLLTYVYFLAPPIE